MCYHLPREDNSSQFKFFYYGVLLYAHSNFSTLKNVGRVNDYVSQMYYKAGGGHASCAHEWLLQRLAVVIAQGGIAAVALGRCVLSPWHLVPLGTLVKHEAPWTNDVADRGATGTCRHRFVRTLF